MSTKKQDRYLLKKYFVTILLFFLLITLFFSVTYFIVHEIFRKNNNHDSVFKLTPENLLKIHSEPPVISGIMDEDISYSFISESVSSYMNSFFYKDTTFFHKPQIELKKKSSSIKINAQEGELTNDKNNFFLKNNVEIISDNNFALRSEEIIVHSSNFNLITDKNIEIEIKDMYIYSDKGFSAEDNLEHISLYGPIVMSDLEVEKTLIHDHDIFERNFFRTKDNIILDQNTQTIRLDSEFYLVKDDINIIAGNINATYKKLSELLDFSQGEDMMDLYSQIEVNNGIVIKNNNNESSLRSDKYVYNDEEKEMIFISHDNDIIYEDDTYILRAGDKIQFNRKTRVANILGNPNLETKNTEKNKNYKLSFNQAEVKLTNNDYSIEYVEIFESVEVILHEEYQIYADYGYFDYSNKIIYLDGDVSIIYYNRSKIEGCAIIVDTLTGEAKLLNCDERDLFKTTIVR